MTITTTKKTTLRTATPNKCMKPVYCTDNGKRWPSATACAEDLGVTRCMVYHVCNGMLKTCKGLHLCYEEDVEAVQTGMSNTLMSMSAEVESMRAELERLRAMEKTYNKEQAAKTAHEEAIAKAEQRVARRQKIYDKDKARADYSLERLQKAMQELDDLKNGRK